MLNLIFLGNEKERATNDFWTIMYQNLEKLHHQKNQQTKFRLQA